MPITKCQRKTLEAVATWMEIRARTAEPNARWPNPADIVHSALLRRLLEGKKPTPEPPPTRFSYPDYELATGNKVEVLEVSVLPLLKDQLTVDQSTWFISKVLGEDDYEAEWRMDRDYHPDPQGRVLYRCRFWREDEKWWGMLV